MTHQDIVRLQDAIQALVQEKNSIESTLKVKHNVLTRVTIQQFETEVQTLDTKIVGLTDELEALAKQIPLKALTTPQLPPVREPLDELIGESSEDDELAPVQLDNETVVSSTASDTSLMTPDELIQNWTKQLSDYLRTYLSTEGISWLDFLIKKATDELSKTFGGHLTTMLKKEFEAYIKKKSSRIALNITDYYFGKVQKEDVLKAMAESFLTSYFQTNEIGGITFEALLSGEWGAIENHIDFQKIKDDLKHQLLRGIIRIGRTKINNSVLPILDRYLGSYTIWKGVIYETGLKKLSIGPFWGLLNIDLTFQSSLKASLKSERKDLSIAAIGELTGDVQVGMGMTIGLKVPCIGEATLSGGLRGGPFFAAKTGLIIGVDKGVLKAGMQAITLSVDMKTFIYIDTPIPEHFLKSVATYMKKISVDGQTVSYEIGSINILTAKTPDYVFTFDLTTGKYNYLAAKGNYVFKINPRLTKTVEDMQKTMVQVMEDVKKTINSYTEVDINPFDEEGWIGQYFA